ncbi:uncharacterized protein LOC9653678 isoform X2 [Selaginella moellendorffii]|uniref:uncharacterized protein LOC9653678 isoform X2 n=1 Tax=Selaginella moellendorffii TaxID=88036 RepID=UPI000D1CDCF6|nr:uncharacterized protein LOC9653678 isoform X2 [Selaginella moellendorffii]|eukprot:XP_024539226.1 uncharacterized protein LOC9653678 isoform X2 [Selaginella moellendorffii]
MAEERASSGKALEPGAWFEIVESGSGVQLSPPFPSVAIQRPLFKPRSLFFARIGSDSATRQAPPAAKKVEHYTVFRIAGDGRCMFRALAQGLAANKGVRMSGKEEKEEADQLKMAVREALCTSEQERRQHEDALISVTVDESLKRQAHGKAGFRFCHGCLDNQLQYTFPNPSSSRELAGAQATFQSRNMEASSANRPKSVRVESQ